MARRLRQLAQLSVAKLERVGPKRLEGLKEMGIETVLDLITHYPRRYLDRTAQVAIRELKVGEEALVLGTVKRAEARRTRNNRSMTEIDVFDGSGYLKATFFNQPWRAKQLPAGTEIAMFGKVDVFNGTRKMTNPVVDLVGNRTGKIVPLYPQSEKSGLTTWELGEWIEEALERAGDFAEPLPERWADELDIVSRTWAMRQIHLPESMGAAQAARRVAWKCAVSSAYSRQGFRSVPPPNHQACGVQNIRVFRCTAGQCGLTIWATSEMPEAQNRGSLSIPGTPRAAIACCARGASTPKTSETLTPTFSNTLPPRITLITPPPPPEPPEPVLPPSRLVGVTSNFPGAPGPCRSSSPSNVATIRSRRLRNHAAACAFSLMKSSAMAPPAAACGQCPSAEITIRRGV